MNRTFEITKTRVSQASYIGLFVLLVISFAACSDNPVVMNPNNANKPVGSTKPSPAGTDTNVPMPKSSGGGDAIDTSKLDEQVSNAETQAKKKPDDKAARAALAEAYLARAGALTKARQYRAALGDYRRTLKYDPDNADAQEMSATIIGILQQMGREVPKEGEEPAPLPYTKGATPESPKSSY
jgi:tetratricopeptide (TPR) repeat protein